MTDQQLQLALAKMLPDKIEIFKPLTQDRAWYQWRDIDNHNTIRNTEWLHVCWLVEQSLDDATANNYVDLLLEIVMEQQKNKPWGFPVANASWQQRAETLCKVKNI